MTAARLFCIPYAGGSANLYRPWNAFLGEDVELCPLELPGRGHRIGEAPVTRLDRLVDVVADHVLARAEVPFALFGHSFGALLAFESARVLQACGASPAALFVSVHRAPHLPQREKPIHQLSDQDFLAEVVALGGSPPGFLDNTELIGLVLPALRADFLVSDTYQYRPGARIRCPVKAFSGVDDRLVRIAEVQAWRNHAAAEFRVQLFPGGHFYVHERPAELLREVTRSRWWENAAVSARS